MEFRVVYMPGKHSTKLRDNPSPVLYLSVLLCSLCCFQTFILLPQWPQPCTGITDTYHHAQLKTLSLECNSISFFFSLFRHSPGYLEHTMAAESDHEFLIFLPTPSQVLGLQACTTVPAHVIQVLKLNFLLVKNFYSSLYMYCTCC